MRGKPIGVLAVVSLGMTPLVANAQGVPRRVTYKVEFSTQGSLLDRTCTATGTDVLTGELAGMESADSTEDNEYVGTLWRATSITMCGVRRNSAGEDVNCNMNFAGSGRVDVKLTVQAQGRGGYLQYVTDRAAWGPRWHTAPQMAIGPAGGTVNGTCDPAEMAHLQNTYTKGETAGSPNGQPLEVTRFPPASYPFTFSPNPPVSIWTLKVISRQP
jgi:hypothetical protein